MTHHPVPKLQIRVTYDPRSRSYPVFQTEEVVEDIKMGKNAKIGLIEMDEDSTWRIEFGLRLQRLIL